MKTTAKQLEPVTLSTDRLLLRPFELTDVDDVYAYARDPEWGRYLPVRTPYEHRHAVEFVARSVLASWATNPTFAICLNGRAVGGINVQVDACKRTAEMGYSIAREHWGRGLVAEATEAVMDWAFKAFGLAKGHGGGGHFEYPIPEGDGEARNAARGDVEKRTRQ